MVGVGTALADDPALTVRLPGLDRKPLAGRARHASAPAAALAARDARARAADARRSPDPTRRARPGGASADLGVDDRARRARRRRPCRSRRRPCGRFRRAASRASSARAARASRRGSSPRPRRRGRAFHRGEAARPPGLPALSGVPRGARRSRTLPPSTQRGIRVRCDARLGTAGLDRRGAAWSVPAARACRTARSLDAPIAVAMIGMSR